MNQPGTIETGRKDRIVGLYSQAHNLAIGGDYAQALEFYDKIIADVPRLIFETPRINYERALCLKALGRIEQAEQAIRSCLSVRPDDPESLRLLSNIQSIKGRHGETRPRAEVQAVKIGTEKVEEMRREWNYLSSKSRLGFISHLQDGEVWDDLEFHLTGIRFVERMMERFEEYGRVEPSRASILEVGCGVGRMAKPLACRFRHVFGVDISANMVEVSREYCSSLPNVVFSVNDGFSLGEFSDSSFEYCVTAGVFQHITDLNVIMNYIREAIRILKPEGIFLFQFEGNRENAVGHGTCGARITAKVLDAALKDRAYRIREVSIDPADPVRNVVIVLQKTFPGEPTTETERSFQLFRMSERRWLSGVYDDIKTKTRCHRRFKEPQKRLTFYDCE
ncbi:MAG: methyltransferase domain-containing protein [Planctomycetota bacterium]|nr:MAG: methyltransferase domain-containing protein [Planctomycetota bacterium]